MSRGQTNLAGLQERQDKVTAGEHTPLVVSSYPLARRYRSTRKCVSSKAALLILVWSFVIGLLGGMMLNPEIITTTFFTPRAHARARGYVIGRGVYILYISLHFFLEPIFYLPKYSLSEVQFNTDRLLIEFNGLWYSLAARQVFVAIANPDNLSFG